MAVEVAFPFVTVVTDTSGLQVTVKRAPGVLAVVGITGSGSSAAANAPVEIVEAKDANVFKGSGSSPLHDALMLARSQNPAPSKVYGVKVEGTEWEKALASLGAADDVTIVALAGVHPAPRDETEPQRTRNRKGDPKAGARVTAIDALKLLKKHVTDSSNDGNKRIGVASIDPLGTATTAELKAWVEPLRSERMVMVAAKGVEGGDAGVAVAATIAAYPPSVSTVLKQVNGLAIPLAMQYGPGDIKALSEAGFVPIIDPALISGTSLHLAEGQTLSTDSKLRFIDTVRTLDDIDFRLKAGLIGLIGDARITRTGLITLKARIEGILGVVQREQAIDTYSVGIPVLDILSLPEEARTEPDKLVLADARLNRVVNVNVQVTLGPATHRVAVKLFVS